MATPHRFQRALARCAAAAALGLSFTPVARAQVIDPAEAAKAFELATARCQADGGRLWGKSLCGPLLFVEPQSRALVASEADEQGILRAQNGIFVGTLPAEVNVANTALDWAGKRWSMMIWPLPEDPDQRAALLLHELFHRVQKEIGLPTADPANAHLDSAAGRTWLRLELRALEGAAEASLRGEPDRAWQALQDALLFRAARRTAFPTATGEENTLELNEGLAEYTGLGAGLLSEEPRWKALLQALRGASTASAFTRSFAYLTGPAYGLWLDRTREGWQRELTAGSDLGALLSVAGSSTSPSEVLATAEKRSTSYGGAEIRAAEREREAEQRKRQAGLRRRFLDGPVLVIPLEKMNISFNPHTLEPLPEAGTVYPTARITDLWGILEVTAGGVLLNGTWSEVRLPAPSSLSGPEVRGEGWTLRLNEGWKLVPGTKEGDWRVAPGEKDG